MYGYCRVCEYDTKDKNHIEEIFKQIVDDGGEVELTKDGRKIVCPICLKENTIKID